MSNDANPLRYKCVKISVRNVIFFCQKQMSNTNTKNSIYQLLYNLEYKIVDPLLKI